MRSGVLGVAVVILIILGFLLILTGGHGKKPATNTGPAVMALPDYADTDATTTLTIDGIVNGDEDHRAIRITVGADQRELDIIQGYSGHVLSTKTFYNTPQAYGVFLRSINDEGFLTRLKNSKSPNDERGQCPLGNRYIFELDQEGDTLSRLWASDCGATTGTFGGQTSQLQELFQDQIPGYNDLTGDVNLSNTD